MVKGSAIIAIAPRVPDYRASKLPGALLGKSHVAAMTLAAAISKTVRYRLPETRQTHDSEVSIVMPLVRIFLL